MKKISTFDLLIMAVLVLFLALALAVYFRPERDLGQPATLIIQVDQNAQAIKEEASKKGVVFMNGQNKESQILEVAQKDRALIITISGFGKSSNGYEFNGQRVLIGQKAELHGSFFAQGIITGFSLDENK